MASDAAIFVTYLINMIHPDGKQSKMYLGLYQVINSPCQWTNIGNTNRCSAFSFSWSHIDILLLKFDFYDATLIIISKTMIY